MTPTVAQTAPYPVRRDRVGTIRANIALSAIGPAMAAIYTAGTWGAPHRPAMLGVIAGMLAVFGLGWGLAPAIAHWRTRYPVQVGAILFSLASLTVLVLLDGGVAGPLGVFVPICLVFLAITVPPRIFGVLAALCLAAYWTAALVGGPPPPGYALVHTLLFGGVSYLCLRHAGALASLRRRLAELSRVDPLTRCLNRRGFDERVAEALSDSARTGRPVTLVLIDLDRFKEINDTYGHRRGDEVLAWVGETLSREAVGRETLSREAVGRETLSREAVGRETLSREAVGRETLAREKLGRELGAHDAVGRLGGDEFAVLLSGSGPGEADATVGRLRAALQPCAPASLGHACYPGEAGTVEQLKHLADERVYRDKRARDRQLPTPEAVAAARRADTPPAPIEVSKRERRRHSIADVGWVSIAKASVCALYAVAYAATVPRWPQMVALCSLAIAIGLGTVLASDRLSRWSATRYLLMAISVVNYLTAASVAAAGGGVSSPVGMCMLVSLPLMALSSPLRAAVPVLVSVSAIYIVVAVGFGASDGWYVATHLGGVLAVSAVCAMQGRTAARQRALVTRLTRVDTLTGCLNRRGFQERFTTELADARRAGHPVSLLIFDLDGFKQLNDSQGHAAGDELLRWVGATLGAHLRADDVVGRLGGDEFVALVGGRPGTAESDVADTAQRLRRALAERTDACVGAATLDEHGHDFDALYAYADAQLYAQKARRGPSPRAPLPHGADASAKTAALPSA
ncbi:GGDEF domain-containing protein [Actinoplanes sp. NPDC051346]|uniref:GGDEF domain-containing protein n=1 Tax=Actinoplanes sp. NPDC051346 TaxID=3155048 RepID=UPI0034419F08